MCVQVCVKVCTICGLLGAVAVAHRSNTSIVFSIVTEFFSLFLCFTINMITHKPLHFA